MSSGADRGRRNGRSRKPRPQRSKKPPPVRPLAFLSSVRGSIREGRRRRALAQSAPVASRRSSRETRRASRRSRGDYRLALLACALPFCLCLGLGAGILLSVEEPLSAQEPEGASLESNNEDFDGFEPLPSSDEGYELTVGVSAIDGAFALSLLSTAAENALQAGGTVFEAGVASAGSTEVLADAAETAEAALAPLIALGSSSKLAGLRELVSSGGGAE